ncbi:hypothetical protein M231_04293 [Tremella mesenterica]|uniref:Uncharacterized protein n=1 Tax=Tremella mesenterica TaxID=5217 RepID=A0A4Q1BKU9_TREME|nr:hypothetical protein M231_04293 [Tremella mesenterica]
MPHSKLVHSMDSLSLSRRADDENAGYDPPFLFENNYPRVDDLRESQTSPSSLPQKRKRHALSHGTFTNVPTQNDSPHVNGINTRGEGPSWEERWASLNPSTSIWDDSPLDNISSFYSALPLIDRPPNNAQHQSHPLSPKPPRPLIRPRPLNPLAAELSSESSNDPGTSRLINSTDSISTPSPDPMPRFHMVEYDSSFVSRVGDSSSSSGGVRSILRPSRSRVPPNTPVSGNQVRFTDDEIDFDHSTQDIIPELDDEVSWTTIPLDSTQDSEVMRQEEMDSVTSSPLVRTPTTPLSPEYSYLSESSEFRDLSFPGPFSSTPYVIRKKSGHESSTPSDSLCLSDSPSTSERSNSTDALNLQVSPTREAIDGGMCRGLLALQAYNSDRSQEESVNDESFGF